MSDIQLLLIQIRQPGTLTEAHEQRCFERKLASRPLEMHVRNAIRFPADPTWLEGIDAVLIGGSGHYSVHHPKSRPWVDPLRNLLDSILENALPCFGICFGHQLLGFHLGAPVEADEQQTEYGTCEIEMTQAGRNDPLFEAYGTRWPAHSGHTDSVVGVPEGITLLARNDRVETQAFRVDGLPVYSTQFHPDLTAEEALERYRSLMDPEAEIDSPVFLTEGDTPNSLLGRFVDQVASDRS